MGDSFCSKVGVLHLRNGLLWTRRQGPFEIHHCLNRRKRSTSTLLQSSIHDHRALDSLPTCLDRLRRRTTCIPILGSLSLHAHGCFSKMRLRIHDCWSTGCTRKDPSNRLLNTYYGSTEMDQHG